MIQYQAAEYPPTEDFVTSFDLFEELHLDSSQCNLLLIGVMLESFPELNPILLEVMIASQVQRDLKSKIKIA